MRVHYYVAGAPYVLGVSGIKGPGRVAILLGY